MVFTFILFWGGFAIAVAVAANTRGRNAAGWFFLALLISPLLAGLIVLALPSLVASGLSANRPFAPEGVLEGIPYRLLPEGAVEAMLPGGRVIFPDLDQLAAAARGATVEHRVVSPEVRARYPDEVNGHRCRVEKDGTVSMLTNTGDEVAYPDWKTFWSVAHGGAGQAIKRQDPPGPSGAAASHPVQTTSRSGSRRVVVVLSIAALAVAAGYAGNKVIGLSERQRFLEETRQSFALARPDVSVETRGWAQRELRIVSSRLTETASKSFYVSMPNRPAEIGFEVVTFTNGVQEWRFDATKKPK